MTPRGPRLDGFNPAGAERSKEWVPKGVAVNLEEVWHSLLVGEIPLDLGLACDCELDHVELVEHRYVQL